MEHTTLFGMLIGFATTIVAAMLVRRTMVTVKPFSTTLILRFGKVIETLSNPGLQWKLGLLIPGTTRLSVSHALEGLRIEDVHVNDRDGTTMRMDFWLECRIVDAKAALFAVEDWRDSLRGVLKHSLMSGGGTRRFENIISERDSLVQEVLSEAAEHARRWGIQIEALSIQDIRVLPDVTRQLFDRVAAQIEMEKARLEEEGRIAIHHLEAETERKVAELRARARSHASLAVGRAYADLRKKPKVLEAYETLHRYSILQPGKTTTFFGFGGDELSVLDAAMLPESTSKTAEKVSSGSSH